jgi:Flp pilus assembly protein TadG
VTQERQHARDAGGVTVFLLLLMLCLLALLGLVAEGGTVFSAREAAAATAEQAARAGAGLLDQSTIRAGGIATGGTAAIEAAEHYLAINGYKGTAAVTGTTVSVTVAPFDVPTPLLALAGTRYMVVSASAKASAVDG